MVRSFLWAFRICGKHKLTVKLVRPTDSEGPQIKAQNGKAGPLLDARLGDGLEIMAHRLHEEALARGKRGRKGIDPVRQQRVAAEPGAHRRLAPLEARIPDDDVFAYHRLAVPIVCRF